MRARSAGLPLIAAVFLSGGCADVLGASFGDAQPYPDGTGGQAGGGGSNGGAQAASGAGGVASAGHQSGGGATPAGGSAATGGASGSDGGGAAGEGGSGAGGTDGGAAGTSAIAGAAGTSGTAGAAGSQASGGTSGGKSGSGGKGGSGGGGAGGAGGFSGGAGGAAGNAGSGGAPCVPKSCTDLGANCGTLDDGCGTQIDCGSSCQSPLSCNQPGAPPNVCGCTPDSYVCDSSNTELKRCSSDGSAYSSAGNCPAGTCVTGAMGMTGTCAQCAGGPTGTLLCQAFNLVKCTDNGAGNPPSYAMVQACGSPEQCDAAAGKCDACIAGSYLCLANTLKKCTNGTQIDKVADCATDELCALSVFIGTCKLPVCNSGDFRCDGAKLETCNAGRTGFDVKDTCMSKGLCDAVSQQCLPPACTTGEASCTGNVLKVCNPDQSGFDVIPCQAPTPACDPMMKACVDRGPAMAPVGSPLQFYIDATEVTNAQYNAFLAATVPVGIPAQLCGWNMTYGLPVSGADDKPVTNVDWCDANNYCAWAGKRLCGAIGGGAVAFADTGDDTKSQWTDACDGGAANKQLYPYASKYSAGTCNDSGASPSGDTVGVGLLGQCQGFPAGLFDMSGNAAEWEDGCAGNAGESDICPARGGSYKSAQADLTCTAKLPITRSTQLPMLGFRCCADP